IVCVKTVGHRATESQRRREKDIVEKAPFLLLLCASVSLWLTFAYRSTSPKTISILPMTATTSAINEPSTIVGSAERLTKEGARMWTRYGRSAPSLTTWNPSSPRADSID